MSSTALPRVILKRRRALPFFKHHPWVFAGAIHRVDGDPKPGDEVALVSDQGEFIARGLYNPQSNISVRLYCWEQDRPLDKKFWSEQLQRAIGWRQRLFPDASHSDQPSQSAHRLVYSEADGISGLIVDRYADWLLVQFTSLALFNRKDDLIALLQEQLNPAGIWMRTEKGIREAEGMTASDGLLSGTEPPRPLFIEENGVRFGIDVVEGQKTGFFLDQRENRAAVSRYVANHRVLDAFCYTGGFGLTALVQGNASEVLFVDVSKSAIATARANAELNSVDRKIRFETGRAFDILEQLNGAGEQFDSVILDPPKLTRSRSGVAKAMRGYFSLNRLAVDLSKPDGLLVRCSCSGHVDHEQFETMLADVSLQSGRAIQILEKRGLPADHPVSVHCAENAYLKCYICRVA